MASISLSASAQSKLMTMEQLTPGHPDFVSVKGLQQVKWNDQDELEYKLPEDTTQQKSANNNTLPSKKETKSEVIETWRSTLPNEEGIVYGESVHRNEFGIDGGIFWAPESVSRFAFYRMDESMVGKYPLLQTDPREAEVKWVRYPMAGMTSHQVTLGIYDANTQQTVYLKTNSKPNSSASYRDESRSAEINDPEHYLTCVTWRPDGKQIFVAELNRLQNYMELNVYDAATGEYVETLFSETAEKYVEPEHPLFFLPGSNNLFVWQDERDGWDHLYLYDLGSTSTRLQKEAASYHIYKGIAPVRQLTQGDWMVTSLLGADPKGKALYFMATKESPLESHLYSVEVKSGKMKRLTTEAGVHAVKLNKACTKFYDSYSNHTTPRICQTVEVKSGKREVLYTATNPFEPYERPEVEVSTLKAVDGETDLYYRLVKPLHFDASKKYPVIVYLYNGPHTKLVREGYEYGLPGWDAYMAQQGFVVFTIDGRGSSDRGLAFEQTIWHNLGENEGKDQMQGIAFLKSLPYVDAERIGIYGWSYGGFMTTYMMINYPETFKVGVCGGPVLDWSRYEVMYGERYMGTPDNNAEGYARNCMVEHAGDLKGRLLIIHDDQDDTVVPQMSVQFLRKSVETGTYPDFMIYANHPHNVRGKDRAHLLTRIAQYFIEHL